MELMRKMLRVVRGPGEKKVTIQDVIENLRFIAEGERHIAEFYQLCGDVLSDDKAFWHDLAASERAHAEAALRMADLVEKEPGKYKPGRSFSVLSIRLFGLYLRGLVDKMRAGEINKNELFSLAVDLECSVVELNYGDIVETDVEAYHALARLLEEETGEHRQLLEKRMKIAAGEQ